MQHGIKQVRLLALLIFTNWLCAMEMEVTFKQEESSEQKVASTKERQLPAPIPEAAECSATHKKKKKKKRGTSELAALKEQLSASKTAVDSPRDSAYFKQALTEIIKNKFDFATLDILYSVANILLFHAHNVRTSLQLIDLVNQLKEITPYVYRDNIPLLGIMLQYEQDVDYEVAPTEMPISAPSAIAFALQNAALLKRMYFYPNELQRIQSVFETAQNEVKQVAGFFRHYMLSWNQCHFRRINLFYFEKKIDSFVSLHNLFDYLLQNPSDALCAFINELPGLEEMVKAMFGIYKDLMNAQESVFSKGVYLMVTKKINNTMKLLHNLTETLIRPSVHIYEELYAIIVQQIDLICRKKPRHVRAALHARYKKRACEPLFFVTQETLEYLETEDTSEGQELRALWMDVTKNLYKAYPTILPQELGMRALFREKSGPKKKNKIKKANQQKRYSLLLSKQALSDSVESESFERLTLEDAIKQDAIEQKNNVQKIYTNTQYA